MLEVPRFVWRHQRQNTGYNDHWNWELHLGFRNVRLHPRCNLLSHLRLQTFRAPWSFKRSQVHVPKKTLCLRRRLHYNLEYSADSELLLAI